MRVITPRREKINQFGNCSISLSVNLQYQVFAQMKHNLNFDAFYYIFTTPAARGLEELCTPKKTRTHFLCQPPQKDKQHQTTAKNGQTATIQRPPPWQIFAISWPKIIVQKIWSNQDTPQDPAQNLDERRGAAQRFHCSLASLTNRSCSLPSKSSSAWNWWWFDGYNT